MDIEILKAEFEASECFKRFERVVQYVTFDFGTYCAKVDIPKDAEKFVSGLIFSWKAWREAKDHEAEKLKGCVMVPVRTDNEIIDQTIKLMDLLATSTNRFQRDPKCIFPFESNNPRVKEWWYVACQIQELLTNTDPTNCDFDEYKADVEAARGGNENT